MSMSSTQARILLNTEQLANCEFEGQQINQARSVLSAKSAAEQASMLSLEVPTPPATTDYQTVQYNGSLGATKYSFDASSVKPNGENYTITMKEQKYGDSLQKNVQIAIVDTNSNGGFKGTTLASTIQNKTTKTDYDTMVVDNNSPTILVPLTQADIDAAGETEGDYWKKDGNSFKKFHGVPDSTCYKKGAAGAANGVHVSYKTEEVNTGSPNFIQRDEIDNIYILDGGAVRKATENDFDPSGSVYNFRSGVTYIKKDNNGAETFQAKGDIAGVTVGNKGVHELTEEEMQLYGDALANCGLKDANGNDYSAKDFFIYYDDKGGAVFVLKNDVYDGNNNAVTYSYVANGEYTKNQTYDDAKLIFDPSNGRITEVQIPNYDKEGNIISWSSITVEAETVIDNAAYDDACAQYQYDNMIYEQKLQECQKKIDDIQREDKNLELQLQRLDTKRQQLTTEKEALEKVLQDAVESYKTFSG